MAILFSTSISSKRFTPPWSIQHRIQSQHIPKHRPLPAVELLSGSKLMVVHTRS
jgi:hypothetical protein